MAYILLVFFVVLVFLSFEKKELNNDCSNSYDRYQQLSMRGICAMIIVLSHMYRNTQIYNDQLAAGIVSLISPSLLCMFFFYAGFAVMYKYENRGGANPV